MEQEDKGVHEKNRKLNKPFEKIMFVPNLKKIIENCNLYSAGIWMYKNMKF